MKKLSKIFVLVLVMLVLCLALVACGEPTTEPDNTLNSQNKEGVEYTVKYELAGGTAIGNGTDERKFPEGTVIQKPNDDPTKENFYFTGWYTTADGNELFNFDNEINANTTIYAQWKIDVRGKFYTTEDTLLMICLVIDEDTFTMMGESVPYTTEIREAKVYVKATVDGNEMEFQLIDNQLVNTQNEEMKCYKVSSKQVVVTVISPEGENAIVIEKNQTLPAFLFEGMPDGHGIFNGDTEITSTTMISKDITIELKAK